MSERPSEPDDRLTEADSAPESVDVGAMHAPIMRENNEPRDGFEPIPIWLVTLFGALLFWGGWYLATYNGGWRSDILDEEPSARMVVIQSGPLQPPDPLVLGEKLYVANCASCHGAGGTGQSGIYPPLAGSEWVVGSPARLTRVVLHGLEGPVTVKGVTYSNSMPAFAQRMNDAQTAALLTYIRHAWENGAAPLTAEQVAAAREASKDQKFPYQAAELLAVVEEDPVPGAAAPAPIPTTIPAAAPGK